MRADGMMWLPPSSFLSGRLDYLGGLNATIPANVVHNVTMTHPRDETGGATNRVRFFRAATSDEAGSPPVTKSEAYTTGYYGQPHINFDSHVWYHTPAQYHFRAYSGPEAKDTFWVKPATNTDVLTGTRADMYVSGNVGVGVTAQPYAKLTVSGSSATSNTAGVASSYGGILLSNYIDTTVVLRTLGGGHSQLATDYPGRFLSFATGQFAERMRIDTNGNVGIGTTAPAYMLDVNGATRIAGNLTVGGTLTGGNIAAKYRDIAEWVEAASDIEDGTVVILNPEVSDQVMPSARSYDTTVAGVVSAQPGLVLGEESGTREKIATTGRVRVKVDATVAPIKIGDLLVTSDKPGFAMKSQPVDISGMTFHRPGTIIGKALEPFASGTGEILVLLSMQ